jgi:hypothetical protein
MKRSTLVVITVAGLGVTAYALAQTNGCRQSDPKAVPGDAPKGCSSSHGGGHAYGHGFYSSGSSSSGSSGTSSDAGATSRGGFGATGHGMAGGE